jgi:two-component system, NtrC family, C4-dicarboxylate transport response regulator DctD
MSRIVLVEDDEPLRAALTELLEAAGHLVTALDNAELAVPALDRVDPEVVVTDLRLPGMDGLAFAALVRDHDDQVPVILISGDFPDGPLPPGGPGEPTERIRKPFRASMLLNAIDRALVR